MRSAAWRDVALPVTPGRLKALLDRQVKSRARNCVLPGRWTNRCDWIKLAAASGTAFCRAAGAFLNGRAACRPWSRAIASGQQVSYRGLARLARRGRAHGRAQQRQRRPLGRRDGRHHPHAHREQQRHRAGDPVRRRAGLSEGLPHALRTFSSIRRVALTLGLPLEHERKVDIVQRYHERMQDLKPLPPRFVKDGPILRMCHGRRRRRAEIPGAAPSRAGQGALHRHRRLRHHPGPGRGLVQSRRLSRARSMTARPSAARSPRASTAASTATSISSAASR